jgi:hypothetical protein
VDPTLSKSTVYFDGSCPLCQAEISYYCRQGHAGAFCFVDVSEPGAVIPAGVTRQLAMKRFHIRAVMARCSRELQHSSKFGRVCPGGAGWRAQRRCREP